MGAFGHISGADWPVPRWSTSTRSRCSSKPSNKGKTVPARLIALWPGPPASIKTGSGLRLRDTERSTTKCTRICGPPARAGSSGRTMCPQRASVLTPATRHAMVGSGTGASDAPLREGKAKSSNASQGQKTARLQERVEGSIASSGVEIYFAIGLENLSNALRLWIVGATGQSRPAHCATQIAAAAK